MPLSSYKTAKILVFFFYITLFTINDIIYFFIISKKFPNINTFKGGKLYYISFNKTKIILKPKKTQNIPK